MEAIFYSLNTYFDSIIILMLALILAFIALNTAVHTNLVALSEDSILSRMLSLSFMVAFTVLFCLTYVLSKTDPDFSVLQRYTRAFQSIKSFVLPVDPFLRRGGLEEALKLDTDFANSREHVFFTIGNELYRVNLDGSRRKLLFASDEEILQGKFSPDGRYIAMKMTHQIAVYSIHQKKGTVIYQFPVERIAPKTDVRMGSVQWSPDSQKICFFVEKVSSVASQTQWFIYYLDLSQEAKKIALGSHSSAFLHWGEDSQRLYFRQVFSRGKEFLTQWFQIPLETLHPEAIKNVRYFQPEIPSSVLEEKGIHLFQEDKRLRFDSAVPFTREGHFISPSGKRLWINRNLQLCYQSSYGVRFKLFGLSLLQDYLSVPPKGKENAVAIQDIRWMPSEKYVLVKHHTYGLLVLSPIRQKIGVLVSNGVGIYGVYPEK